MTANTNIVESTHSGKTRQWIPEGNYADLSRTQTLTLLNQRTVRSNGKTLQQIPEGTMLFDKADKTVGM